jgi:hypothetical protein
MNSKELAKSILIKSDCFDPVYVCLAQDYLDLLQKHEEIKNRLEIIESMFAQINGE